jgi:hypothetical protein
MQLLHGNTKAVKFTKLFKVVLLLMLDGLNYKVYLSSALYQGRPDEKTEGPGPNGCSQRALRGCFVGSACSRTRSKQQERARDR